MLRLCGMIAIALIATVSAISSFESSAEANNRAAVRAQIRSTPMLNRPYRVGHVYGNTVRRVAK